MRSFPRSAHFQAGLGRIAEIFRPHAEFVTATQHPESEGPVNMADGLPESDQYGAVHTNKNDTPETHWQGPGA
jgi:hypothetical protein